MYTVWKSLNKKCKEHWTMVFKKTVAARVFSGVCDKLTPCGDPRVKPKIFGFTFSFRSAKLFKVKYEKICISVKGAGEERELSEGSRRRVSVKGSGGEWGLSEESRRRLSVKGAGGE